MTTTVELLREGRTNEIWDKYCGFLDLDLAQFMQIQRRLLQEQMQLLSKCELGQHLFDGQTPKNVDEFLRIAPITTYKDYLEYLPTKKEDALPAKPKVWMRTSGRTGEYRGKWVPCSPQFYRQISGLTIGTAILASARHKGDIRLEEGDVFLYTVAPPPYITGTTIRAAEDGEFPFTYVPSIAEAEQMDFQERIQQGFIQSMESGIDYFMGIASILLKIGESFSSGTSRTTSLSTLLRPKTFARLMRAMAMSKLQGRDIVPKDIWTPKGMVISGMDVQIYKDRIEALWGITPLEAYACTEFGAIALQSWGARSTGLTLMPDSAFWEFMPEEEYKSWRNDPSYQPKTFLYDQVSPGRYVLLGTSFNGGAFVRYLIGDLISIISLRDEKVDVNLPQIVMESRADDIIDLGSLVLLTERSIWRAIGELDLSSIDWVMVKEFDENDDPILHMYVEGIDINPEDMALKLHNALISSVRDYSTFSDIMQINPIRVTVFRSGTFQKYLERQQSEQADIGQLKPPRLQPSEDIIAKLLNINEKLTG